MRTIIRDNYDPTLNQYHETIVVDEAREKRWLFDCDGVFHDITNVKVVSERGDSEEYAASQKWVTEEAEALEAADQALQDNIDAEAATRESADETLQDNIDNEEADRIAADTEIWDEIEAIEAASDVVDIVGTYAELENYDTSALKDNDIIKVLQDETHDDAIAYYRWSTSTEAFTFVGVEGPYYTASETDTLLAGKVDKVNITDIPATSEATASSTLVMSQKGSYRETHSSTTDGIQIGTSAGSASAGNRDSIAIGGNSSTSAAPYSTAVGTDAKATGQLSTALGAYAQATGNGSLAISQNGSQGNTPVAAGEYDIAIGGNGCSTKVYSGAQTRQNIAIGNSGITSNGGNSMAIGHVGVTATGSGSTALGYYSVTASGSDSVAIGNNTVEAASWNSVAIGSKNITSSAQSSVAIGVDSVTAAGTNSVAIGSKTVTAAGSNGVAIGTNGTTAANKSNAVAIGCGVTSSGDYSVAVGTGTSQNKTTATGNYNSAFGYWARTSGNYSSAFGSGANASANGATALGQSAGAYGNSSIAIGYNALATTDSAIAIGGGPSSTSAYSYDSVAIGYNSSVRSNCAGSIALGSGSQATTADELSIGRAAFSSTPEKTRKITHVTAGVNSTDAVNVAQLNAAIPTAMTGATSSVAGTSGLVPAPAAGDDTKFLSGDGTWKDVSSGGTSVTKFYVPGSIPSSTSTNRTLYKDTALTVAATGQEVMDAFESGGALIVSYDQSFGVEEQMYYLASRWLLTHPAPDPKTNCFTLVPKGTSIDLKGMYIEYPDLTGTTCNFGVKYALKQYFDFSGATASSAGSNGLVPAPAAGDDVKFLQGNGTWSTLPAANTISSTDWNALWQ